MYVQFRLARAKISWIMQRVVPGELGFGSPRRVLLLLFGAVALVVYAPAWARQQDLTQPGTRCWFMGLNALPHEEPQASKSTIPVLPRTGSAAREQAAGDNTDKASPQLLANQIGEALAKGDTTSVRKLLPEFLTAPRLPADTLLRTGASLAQQDLYSEAAKVFERCVKDFPQFFEGYYNLALAELALRQFPAALNTLAKAPRTTESGEVARTYLRGKIEAAIGRNEEAERHLAAAFAAAPTEENYALDLGLFYFRVHDYQRALAVFQKATSVVKDSPFLQLGLGLGQFLGGRPAEAIETCRSLLAVQPNFSPARVMMGFALYEQGRVEEAESTAAQGLRESNPSAYLSYLHAVCLYKLQSHNYDLMLNDLVAAAQAIPRCSLCFVALSKVHQGKGERKIATADLEKAVSIDPSLPEAWYRLSVLYELAGQADRARKARRRFEELKANKANKETEMLRDVFLKSLGNE
jgi:tetratricopeptide (TPR) repeat protein